jgi:hypothetical protein
MQSLFDSWLSYWGMKKASMLQNKNGHYYRKMLRFDKVDNKDVPIEVWYILSPDTERGGWRDVSKAKTEQWSDSTLAINELSSENDI